MTTNTSPQIVEDMIFDAIAQMGPERSEVTREATFEDLDLDSLDLVEIGQMVEETWGVAIDPQDFGKVKTVGDAVDVVFEKVS